MIFVRQICLGMKCQSWGIMITKALSVTTTHLTSGTGESWLTVSVGWVEWLSNSCAWRTVVQIINPLLNIHLISKDAADNTKLIILYICFQWFLITFIVGFCAKFTFCHKQDARISATFHILLFKVTYNTLLYRIAIKY